MAWSAKARAAAAAARKRHRFHTRRLIGAMKVNRSKLSEIKSIVRQSRQTRGGTARMGKSLMRTEKAKYFRNEILKAAGRRGR